MQARVQQKPQNEEEKSPKIRRTSITVQNTTAGEGPKEDKKQIIIRRMIYSGTISAIMLAIIIYTLPMTVLSVSALFEYATLVSLFLFLLVLLFRYFAVLVMAYIYISQYTFNKNTGFYPFVSIIVPVYNEGVVLKDSIDSLLHLDYSNYEIIIVNDGSTDNTYEVGKTLVGFHKGRYSDIKVSMTSPRKRPNQRRLGDLPPTTLLSCPRRMVFLRSSCRTSRHRHRQRPTLRQLTTLQYRTDLGLRHHHRRLVSCPRSARQRNRRTHTPRHRHDAPIGPFHRNDRRRTRPCSARCIAP